MAWNVEGEMQFDVIDWEELDSVDRKYEKSKVAALNKLAEKAVESEALLNISDFFRLMTDRRYNDDYLKQFNDFVKDCPTNVDGVRYVIAHGSRGEKSVLGTGLTEYPDAAQGDHSLSYCLPPIAGRIERFGWSMPGFVGRLCLMSSEYKTITQNNTIGFINSGNVSHPVLATIARFRYDLIDSGGLKITPLGVHFSLDSALDQVNWTKHSSLQEHIEYAQTVSEIFERGCPADLKRPD